MTVRRTEHVSDSVAQAACTRTFEELLLELGFCDLYFNSLVDLLCVSLLVIGVVLDRRREECVDEGCLSQARLASDLKLSARTSRMGWLVHAYHDGEASTSLCDNFVSLVGQIGNTNRRCRRIWCRSHAVRR